MGSKIKKRRGHMYCNNFLKKFLEKFLTTEKKKKKRQKEDKKKTKTMSHPGILLGEKRYDVTWQAFF
jgi:hypothetical protein